MAVLQMGELLVDEALTARDLAKRMKVSKPTAYARLEALKAKAPELGLRLVTERIREGKTGPKSKAYRLVDAAKAA